MANKEKNWSQVLAAPGNCAWSIQYIEKLKLKDATFKRNLENRNRQTLYTSQQLLISDAMFCMSTWQPNLLQKMKQAFYQKENRDSKKKFNKTISITLSKEDKRQLEEISRKLKMTYSETISALLHDRDREIQNLRTSLKLKLPLQPRNPPTPTPTKLRREKSKKPASLPKKNKKPTPI